MVECCYRGAKGCELQRTLRSCMRTFMMPSIELDPIVARVSAEAMKSS